MLPSNLQQPEYNAKKHNNRMAGCLKRDHDCPIITTVLQPNKNTAASLQ
jgi:hypothetical protein